MPGDTADVIIVGAGPNGLTAGALLAQAGLAVRILEAAETPGGGCRSAELTLPGFVHDRCAAVHPMGILSPAFRRIGIERFGLEWVQSERPVAHPLPDAPPALLDRSLAETAKRLGDDGPAWRHLFAPLANERFIQSLLQPVWSIKGGGWLAKARFGATALRSCEAVARSRFQGEAARALFAGCAAHSVLALDEAGTASFGLALVASAHAIDWPVARRGSQSIVDALVRAFQAAGGILETKRPVSRLDELPAARAIVFDLSPRQIARIAGDALPTAFRRRYERYRHGPAVFKVDWALSRPIPWRDPDCRTATTVHVGGTFDEILRSEAMVMNGQVADRPFVLLTQPSLIDVTRAPAGQHTGWAYCHVPNGSTEDMTSRIENQIERFAPGFRDCILARETTSPADLERYNSAMIGGDMAGGQNDLRNFLFRPVPRWNPYTTPNPRLFVCSSSTPPGGGVHGMCGYHAARAVLKRLGVAVADQPGASDRERAES